MWNIGIRLLTLLLIPLALIVVVVLLACWPLVSMGKWVIYGEEWPAHKYLWFIEGLANKLTPMNFIKQ